MIVNSLNYIFQEVLGIENLKQAPSPRVDSTHILPFSLSMIFLQIDKPIPVPS